MRWSNFGVAPGPRHRRPREALPWTKVDETHSISDAAGLSFERSAAAETDKVLAMLDVDWRIQVLMREKVESVKCFG